MYAVERLSSYISRGVYTVSGPFHPFGGAVDIIVVEQEDGSFKSSPWNVRFGKFQGVLKTKEKIVDISVNGVESNFHMYLDHKGEAFFLKEVDVEEGKSMLYAPSLSSGDEKDDKDEQPRDRRPAKSKSYNFGANGDMPLVPPPPDASNGKIVPRTTSRRGRLLGFVFGQKSMKKESLREKEGDAEVTRISSLERAEIAADLLEVRWATTLAIKNPNKDKASPISAEDCLEIKADDDRNIQTALRVNEDTGNGSDPSQLQEENVGCHRETSDESQPCSHNLVCSVGEVGIEMSYLGTPVETSVLDDTNLGENNVLSGTSGVVEEVVDADDHDNVKSVASSVTVSDSEIPESAGLEVGSYEQLNVEAFDEKNAVLSDYVVLKKENEEDRVQSFMYCETSRSSIVGLDGSIKETQKTLYLACGGSGDDHAHAETLHETTELIPEVLETIHQHTIHHHTVTEGLAENIKSEVKLVKVPESHSQDSSPTHSCLPVDGEGGFEGPLVMQKSLNDEMVRVDSKSYSAEETISHESFIISNFGILGEDQCNEIIRDEKSELEPSLESIGDPHEFVGDCVPTKVMTILSPRSPDEEQFLFSDDDFKSSEVHSLDLMSLDPMEKENSPSLILDSNGKIDDLFDANYESYSPPDSSVQENTPDDLANLIDKSNAVSTPISIPSGIRVTDEEVERQAESLPNIGPCSGDLDSHELHRTISHSLDSNSKFLGWGLLRNNISTFTKSNANDEHMFVQEQPSIDDTQIPRDLKNVLANAAVELSLCKHLLYEGMGAAAASQAFEAEKLDIDKFDSLSPDVLKNDNLVVRIRGHYFPWDAAAPIVMQMLSFGREQILDLKGMIAVDQVENTLEVDPSKAIVTSGGSWRLWPFPFRRSKAIPSVQPSIDNTRQSNSENAEETTDRNAKETTDRNAKETTDQNAEEATDQNAKETTDQNAKDTTDQNAKETTADMDENDIVCKPKLTKKKVRVITPTSEQLASLNLKEGRNTITFTFSTSMLGKQQVDASIYLWKWNTRIVISDVDGTITKSDVLGQFMPMVGVDWSHTGVTHLFSAIKENGYQFLFLSARSISQAYITRQFLFNLKQDGKALPDGPVVISPDGLFPSLYREVIRRAPHEFKIACLEDIRALFPSDCNPFYAGFGNRDSDEISYLKVGIPKGKIFIINPKGEVAVNRLVDTRSYPSLHALVNGMFPPASSTEQEAYNEWNFWRLPPHVDI